MHNSYILFRTSTHCNNTLLHTLALQENSIRCILSTLLKYCSSRLCPHAGSMTTLGRGTLAATSSTIDVNTKSACESEYIAPSYNAANAIILRNFLSAQGRAVQPAKIMQDDEAQTCSVKRIRGTPRLCFMGQDPFYFQSFSLWISVHEVIRTWFCVNVGPSQLNHTPENFNREDAPLSRRWG